MPHGILTNRNDLGSTVSEFKADLERPCSAQGRDEVEQAAVLAAEIAPGPCNTTAAGSALATQVALAESTEARAL